MRLDPAPGQRGLGFKVDRGAGGHGAMVVRVENGPDRRRDRVPEVLPEQRLLPAPKVALRLWVQIREAPGVIHAIEDPTDAVEDSCESLDRPLQVLSLWHTVLLLRVCWLPRRTREIFGDRTAECHQCYRRLSLTAAPGRARPLAVSLGARASGLP